MLFSADSWPGIADGSITVTFRVVDSAPRPRSAGATGSPGC